MAQRTGSRQASRRLGRQDWIDAATIMGGEVGFSRLAVEPLAARLGATKGSFYWHFADRAELLDAVMAAWEESATQQVIQDVDSGLADDALERLIDAVLTPHETDRAEWRIVNSADHPQIGPVVARVHTARTAYIRKLLIARGHAPDAASALARMAYAAYLGDLVLSQTADQQRRPDRAALRDQFVALISSRREGST